LSLHPPSYQEMEMRSSKTRIEAELGQPVLHLSYPYGDYSAITARIAREVGFTAAFTTSEGPVVRSSNAWEIPRWNVGNWEGKEFAHRLAAMFSCQSLDQTHG
jgi:peptidoglycan/xylan/chitin deacetylase (PgdA/CDA1 family)